VSESRRPILVTGSHRSGSTWVGQRIATSPEVGYIHEPFGLNHHPGVCAMRVPYWFLYVTEDNAADFRPYLQKTLRFSYSPLAELRAARKPRHLARLASDGGHFLKYRMRHGRPLMKDPIALFSSDWLASEFDMRVILLVRHPAAFAASLRRLGYRHPFSHFVEQPRLMRDHLGSFEGEIRAMDEEPHGVLEEAALLWRLITFMTLKLRDAHPDWAFYRYEDLVRDPATRFSEMFDAVGLPFTTEVRDGIARTTNPHLTPWKDQLAPKEVAQLRSRVAELASLLYADTDW
jgi:hypothetical protein